MLNDWERERLADLLARQRRIAVMRNWTALCALAFAGCFIAGAMEAWIVCGVLGGVALIAGLISDELRKRV